MEYAARLPQDPVTPHDAWPRSSPSCRRRRRNRRLRAHRQRRPGHQAAKVSSSSSPARHRRHPRQERGRHRRGDLGRLGRHRDPGKNESATAAAISQSSGVSCAAPRRAPAARRPPSAADGDSAPTRTARRSSARPVIRKTWGLGPPAPHQAPRHPGGAPVRSDAAQPAERGALELRDLAPDPAGGRTRSRSPRLRRETGGSRAGGVPGGTAAPPTS